MRHLINFGKSALAVTLAISALLTPVSSLAAHPNAKVVITDMLDDDIRALLHLFADSEARSSVKALIVTTGNVYLKAEIARKIIAGMGLKTPVYAGTSTNLANNSVTSFAANYEREGAPLLSDDEIKSLKTMNGHSGNGADALAKILRETENGKKVDILLLTAATDLNMAMSIDPVSAKRALGDLFTMGLYKKNAAGDLVSPYNTMADTRAAKNFLEIVKPAADAVATADLLELSKKGFFDHIYHVPSDVVQNNSGLPGGYIPDTGEGKELRNRLDAAMKQNPVLNSIMSAAGEYALNWNATANAEFGIGFSNSDRWVPGSFQDPHQAVGFYLADTVPTALLKMKTEQLGQLQFNVTQVKAPDQVTTNVFKFLPDPQGRQILDLQSFDGWTALREHVNLLEKAVQFKALPEFYKTKKFPKSPFYDSSPAKKNVAKNRNSLLVVFKNSPDDWFGLLELLSSAKGRAGLLSGGIICEGFQTEAMRNAVIELLNSMGFKDIAVAAGTEYQRENVEKIPNFKGEILLNDLHQNDKAFTGLKANLDLSQAATVEAVLSKAQSSAKNNNAGIDAILYGEGTDLFNKISADPNYALSMESVFVMGGGRIQNDKIMPSRNWLGGTEAKLKYFDYLGKLGKKVFVYSSNEFGGSMISTTEKQMGNGAVAFSALEKAAQTSAPMKAVFEHWQNWNRVFGWALGPNKEAAFDPTAHLNTLSTSPLGLRIANEYIGERYSDTTVQMTEVKLGYTPEGIVKTSQDGSGVFWASQFGGQTVADLAVKFSSTVQKLTKAADLVVKKTSPASASAASGGAIMCAKAFAL